MNNDHKSSLGEVGMIYGKEAIEKLIFNREILAAVFHGRFCFSDSEFSNIIFSKSISCDLL